MRVPSRATVCRRAPPPRLRRRSSPACAPRARGAAQLAAPDDAGAAGPAAARAPDAPGLDDLVQYVVVLRTKELRSRWPAGAFAAQAAHACVAAVWLSRDAPATRAYLAPGALERMHKVVLEADSPEALTAAAAALEAARLPAALWRELPEDVVTALASAPGERAALKPHFAAFKLMR